MQERTQITQADHRRVARFMLALLDNDLTAANYVLSEAQNESSVALMMTAMAHTLHRLVEDAHGTGNARAEYARVAAAPITGVEQ